MSCIEAVDNKGEQLTSELQNAPAQLTHELLNRDRDIGRSRSALPQKGCSERAPDPSLNPSPEKVAVDEVEQKPCALRSRQRQGQGKPPSAGLDPVSAAGLGLGKAGRPGASRQAGRPSTHPSLCSSSSGVRGSELPRHRGV